MAWETEKRRLALAKLKAFFLDKIEVDRIVLHSLNAHGAFVTTFRTAKLPESVKKELQEAREPQLGVGGGGGAGGGHGAIQPGGPGGGGHRAMFKDDVGVRKSQNDPALVRERAEKHLLSLSPSVS